MTQQTYYNPEQQRPTPTEAEIQRVTTVSLAANAVREHTQAPEMLASSEQIAHTIAFIPEAAPATEAIITEAQPVDENLSSMESAARERIMQITGQKG